MITESIVEAFNLLLSFDEEIYQIIFLSLTLALLATLTALVFGVFFGILISSTTFKGKRFIKKLIFTFMGIPPVVLGLFVLLLTIGPLDPVFNLFTVQVMFFAQFLLVLPIITGNIIISSEKTQKDVLETAETLGAGRIDKIKLLITETKPFILMSMILGFSRAISEVGAVMLVGGNIRYSTRTMTTYIARSNSMGDYSKSIAMGLILLILAFVIHSVLARFRGDFYD